MERKIPWVWIALGGLLLLAPGTFGRLFLDLAEGLTLTILLQALSPQHLLGRGFSLMRDGQGQIVSSIGQLKAGEGVMIELADGALDATVDQIHRQ